MAGLWLGLLDPYGAPWLVRGHAGTKPAPQPYITAVEAAFKVALLTQEHVYLTAGYIFDNPGLQRLLLSRALRSGVDEGQAFRWLLASSTRIATHDREVPDLLDNSEHWWKLVDSWIGNQQRGTVVTPASGITGSFDMEEFVRDVRHNRGRMAISKLAMAHGNDLDALFGILSDTGARRFTATGNNPDFEQPFMRMINDRSRYGGVSPTAIEKILQLQEYCAGKIPLSRSLLSNPAAIREIAGSNVCDMTDEELRSIRLPGRHAHAEAMAMIHQQTEVVGEGRIAGGSYRDPLRERVEETIRNVQLAEGGRLGELISNLRSLSPVSYQRIATVRGWRGTNSTRFYDSLASLRSVNDEDIGILSKRLESHWRLVTESVSRSNETTSPLGEGLHDLVDGLGTKVGNMVDIGGTMAGVPGYPFIRKVIEMLPGAALLRSLRSGVPAELAMRTFMSPGVPWR